MYRYSYEQKRFIHYTYYTTRADTDLKNTVILEEQICKIGDICSDVDDY